MFDELKNNQIASPVNAKPLNSVYKSAIPASPIKAEDIFAEVDKTGKPEVFNPNQNSANLPPRGTVIPPEMSWSFKNNKLMFLGLLLGGLVIVGSGAYLGLRLAFMAKPEINNTAVEESAKSNQTEEAEFLPPAEINETAAPVVLDTDFDGLIDEEEITLGTDINLADTDQDGLTDREEAKVYLTDPLKSDTDGDGFNDGAEISNGYNPKGPGKLLDINKP